MRIVSNLIQARYRDQILFRPVCNGNHTGKVLLRPHRPQQESPGSQTSENGRR